MTNPSAALLILTQNQYRIIQFLFHVFLAWYYCTIQLREHILVANGSRIRPWWIWHHYFSIVLVATLVTWPDGFASAMFYPHFNWFCLYVGMCLCILAWIGRRTADGMGHVGVQGCCSSLSSSTSGGDCTR